MSDQADAAGSPLPDGFHPDLNPGPIFRLTLDGSITFMNTAARELLGGNDALGRPWMELCAQVPADGWERLLVDGGTLRHDAELGGVALSFTLVHKMGTGAVFAYGADVTELKQAQSVLAEQTAELRENALFPEMNPGPVCRLDLHAVVLRANRAALSHFGDDLVGRSWRDVVPEVTAAVWERIVDHGVRFWAEVDVGDTCLGFTMARPPGSAHVYVYGADITALKVAERQLQEMALFPEMNPGPVLRLDGDARILLANRAARELFLGTELLGRSWLELCPAVTRQLLEQVLRTGEPVGHEAQISGRHMLFTHTAGTIGEQVFVYGADLTQLKETERALLQSEKMATLGTLAAGVAHELNNPSAAVVRAAEHLMAIFSLLQEAQLRLNQLSLPAELLETLAQLDAEARERASRPPDLDTLTRSDRESEIEEWLERHEIAEAWDLAPALVSLAVDTKRLDDIAATLPTEFLEPVMVWLSRTYPVYAVLEEVRHGASRISEIVSALRAYSYVDRAPVQSVDLNEGIRHTLIILQNKLRRGVQVELELDPELPRIEAYGGDLNQVWTNLIDNAVDAMNGTGRLTLRSRSDGDSVRVEIEDDGPGIPPEIQGRIFDPFFTTKEPGQGTGLGLNTTYNIVTKKHGGTIELDSAPGRTRFIVRLPHVVAPATP